MNVFVMQNQRNRVDESVLDIVTEVADVFLSMDLPENHNDIQMMLGTHPGGIVVMPAIWEDLLVVKLVQQIMLLDKPYKTIAVGTCNDIASLATAFNEGLSAFITIPAETGVIVNSIKRVVSQQNLRVNELRLMKKNSSVNSYSAHEVFSEKKNYSFREKLVGKLLIQLAEGLNPFKANATSLMNITTSVARQNQFSRLFDTMGFQTTPAATIREALELAGKKEFSVVVSDAVLTDGKISELTSGLKNVCRRMPYIIVLSSSPEKADELLTPENCIDEVVMKPVPDSGIESVLPTVSAYAFRHILYEAK
jgi:DNA-binding NtrC family response regulator